jgi:hypothetical protein
MSDPAGSEGSAETPDGGESRAPREPRPMIERIGLAAIATVLAIVFGGVAAASWVGGELFLAVMGAVGCVMTAWVGVLTLIRG